MRKFYISRLSVIVFCAILFSNYTKGQDAHFSQFYATPLQVNPAMTGVFDGKFRWSNEYRSQWSGIVKGYNTFHLSIDAPLGKGELFKNNFFGIGLMVYQDQAGSAPLKSTVIEGSLSYVTALDDNGDHYFSLGFQGGLNQQSFDQGKATWDSQWNGDSYDPSMPSMESIQLYTFSYLDFNAGAMYYYVPDGYNTFNVGAALQHVGSPNISLYTTGDAPLSRKITVHSSAELSLDEARTAWIDPKVLFMRQGNQQEIMAGGYFRGKVQFKSRYTNYKKEAYFMLGGFYRVGDAFVASARFEYNSFGVGLSYDVNASKLSTLAGSANAIEINLSYISYVKRGQHAKHNNKMPRFF